MIKLNSMRNYNEVAIKDQYIVYFLNGKYHRTDGPAFIYYYENGQVNCVYYYLNDKRHRTDGPAIIRYYENGQIQSEKYYLNSKPLSKKEFDKRCKTTMK